VARLRGHFDVEPNDDDAEWSLADLAAFTARGALTSNAPNLLSEITADLSFA